MKLLLKIMIACFLALLSYRMFVITQSFIAGFITFLTLFPFAVMLSYLIEEWN